MEKIMTVIIAFAGIIFGPYILTGIINGRQNDQSYLEKIDTGRDVIVTIDGENILMDVENYVAGVLPGIVDWKESEDIIQAQAVAVRGNIYYAMGNETVIQSGKLQYVYYDREALKKRLGKNYKKAVKIYEKAIVDTKGITK